MSEQMTWVRRGVRKVENNSSQQWNIPSSLTGIKLCQYLLTLSQPMPTVLSDEGRQPTKRVRIMAEIRINLVDDKKLHSKKKWKKKKKNWSQTHTERWPASSTQPGRPLCSRVTFRPSAVYVSAASLLPFLLHSLSIFLCLFPSLQSLLSVLSLQSRSIFLLFSFRITKAASGLLSLYIILWEPTEWFSTSHTQTQIHHNICCSPIRDWCRFIMRF